MAQIQYTPRGRSVAVSLLGLVKVAKFEDQKITFVNVLSEPKTFGYAYPAALKTQFHRCLICRLKRIS